MGHKKARFEIIPLIDIMFFLLASFMMVSITMTKQRTVGVNLPSAASAQTNLKPDSLSLAVNAAGQVFFEKQPVTLSDTSSSQEGAITRWRWDFGDGQTSTERHPLHRYEKPGEYVVTLEAAGPAGKDSRTKVWDVVLR